MNKIESISICLDFDGTCVTHEYPVIGEDIGAVPILKKLCDNGHNLILFTMRSGIELKYALSWFDHNGIKLYGVNKNPTQSNWTESPKAYAQLYLDDASLCAPLKFDEKLSSRPFMDWVKVEEELKLLNLI